MIDRDLALALLGLDAGDDLTRDRVRRAYLRKLRDHPPERDGDGFRELREAFELLDRGVRLAVIIEDSRRRRREPAGESGRPVTAPARDPDPPPSLDARANELLGGLERGDLAHARAIAADEPIPPRWLVDPVARRRWALARELLDVATLAPPHVVRALAHAIAADDVAWCRPQFAAFRRDHPPQAQHLRRLLRRKAESLLELIEPPRRAELSPAALRLRLAWLSAIVMMLVFAIWSTC